MIASVDPFGEETRSTICGCKSYPQLEKYFSPKIQPNSQQKSVHEVFDTFRWPNERM